MELNKDIPTGDITPDFLAKLKMPNTTISYLFDELLLLKYGEGGTAEDKADHFHDFVDEATAYESQLLHSVVFHTLEIVRGAERRGLLDDLSLNDVCRYVFTDVGFVD
jgi:hypothetical protein